MNFQEVAKIYFDKLLYKLLTKISNIHNIDYEELILFVNDNNFLMKSKTAEVGKCSVKIMSGKRKGELCNASALENGMCKRHCKSKIISDLNNGKIGDQILSVGKKEPKVAQITKTQQKKIDELNTAVKHDDVLIKTDIGLLHTNTQFIFNENFRVLGKKCASGNIIELTSSDVEICDKNGWRIVVDQ